MKLKKVAVLFLRCNRFIRSIVKLLIVCLCSSGLTGFAADGN